jgi:hypothetical protein
MSAPTRKVPFADSEVGIATRLTLERLEADEAYNTVSGYHVNELLYPNNSIPFIDKHMEYLSTHAAVNPTYYLSNLRLMTRRKK